MPGYQSGCKFTSKGKWAYVCFPGKMCYWERQFSLLPSLWVYWKRTKIITKRTECWLCYLETLTSLLEISLPVRPDARETQSLHKCSVLPSPLAIWACSCSHWCEHLPQWWWDGVGVREQHRVVRAFFARLSLRRKTQQLDWSLLFHFWLHETP